MDATSSLPQTSSPAPQRWFVAGLLVLFVALSIQYTFKVLDTRWPRSAIVRWREQILALDRSENIYDTYIYPNPPIMALILKPFVSLPPLVGALAWYYLKVGLTLVTLAWLFRLVAGRDRPFPPLGKALAVLLCLRPIMGDLSHGNVNLFILFLILAALYAIHKGRDALGGLLLALSIACKVTPALFLPYLLWKRAWASLAGCAVGLVLFLGPVPAAFLGWDENAELLTSWTEQMVKPFVRDGIVTSTHNNQSLPGLVFRLGTHSPSFIDYDHPQDPEPAGYRYDFLVEMSPATARWIVKGFMALFSLLVLWTCRTPWSQRGGWRLSAEFSLVVLGMLMFSERTWKHHCVTLVLPIGVLCYYLTTQQVSSRLRGYLIGTLVLTMALMATTSTSLFEDVAKTAQVYGAYVWAYGLLIAAMAVLLRRPEPQEAHTAISDNQDLKNEAEPRMGMPRWGLALQGARSASKGRAES